MIINTTVSNFFNWYFGETTHNVLNYFTGNILDIFGDIIDDDQRQQFDPGTGKFDDIIKLFINTIKKHKDDEIEVETRDLKSPYDHYYGAKFTIKDGNNEDGNLGYGDIHFNLDCMNEFKG